MHVTDDYLLVLDRRGKLSTYYLSIPIVPIGKVMIDFGEITLGATLTVRGYIIFVAEMGGNVSVITDLT